jgi:hypothetical protein
MPRRKPTSVSREPIRIFVGSRDVGLVRERVDGTWTAYNRCVIAGRRQPTREAAERWVLMTYAVAGWFQ